MTDTTKVTAMANLILNLLVHREDEMIESASSQINQEICDLLDLPSTVAMRNLVVKAITLLCDETQTVRTLDDNNETCAITLIRPCTDIERAALAAREESNKAIVQE